MTRLASIALLAMAAGLLSAAPAPVPENKPFVTGWDKPVDPDGDCEFIRENGKLTIRVPGKDHDLGIERGLMNSPRLLQDVEGDFTVQVRIKGVFNPSPDSTSAERISFRGAGLLLWESEKTYIRLERAALFKGEGVHRYANWELRHNGEWVLAGKESTLGLEEKDTYLRLQRKGDKVLASVSQDGKKWNDLEPIEIKLPEKLKIGVSAGGTSSDKFEPTFDQYELTPAKKNK